MPPILLTSAFPKNALRAFPHCLNVQFLVIIHAAAQRQRPRKSGGHTTSQGHLPPPALIGTSSDMLVKWTWRMNAVWGADGLKTRELPAMPKRGIWMDGDLMRGGDVVAVVTSQENANLFLPILD